MRRRRQPVQLLVRWSVGDVHPLGYEILRLSVWGAFRIFGSSASYVICAHTIPASAAERRTGDVPSQVQWRSVSGRHLPTPMRRFFGEGMPAWKLAPPRLSSRAHELALHNDIVLWELPPGIAAWLEDRDPAACCLAESPHACFGRFQELCSDVPRSAGIRGVAPRLALGKSVREVLERSPGPLASELDERGLQIAALEQYRQHLVREFRVPECSPSPLYRPELGSHGAHFVGINDKDYPAAWGGSSARRDASELFRSLRPALYERVGIAPCAHHRGA